MKKGWRTSNVNDRTTCQQHPVDRCVSWRIWNLVELEVYPAVRLDCGEISEPHGGWGWVGSQGDLVLQEQYVLNSGCGQSRGHKFRYRMLLVQVDDRRDGGHRGHGEGRRVDHVGIVNRSNDLRATNLPIAGWFCGPGEAARAKLHTGGQHSRRQSTTRISRATRPAAILSGIHR